MNEQDFIRIFWVERGGNNRKEKKCDISKKVYAEVG